MLEPNVHPGRIIFLNGTSSAGKTTIAAALQNMLDVPTLSTGIDHFLQRISTDKTHTYSDGTSHVTADGWLLVFCDGVMVETPKIGPVGLRLLAGMYQAIAGFAQAGNDVIVDDVIYDPRVLKSAVSALYGFDVLFVGLHCPLDVAEQREHNRGDRAEGGARAFHHLVHAHAVYDLEIDTSKCDPDECARQIKQALDSNLPRTAFASLYKRLAG